MAGTDRWGSIIRARSFGMFRNKNIFRNREVSRLPNERLFLIFWSACSLLHEKVSWFFYRLATLATKTAGSEKWRDFSIHLLRAAACRILAKIRPATIELYNFPVKWAFFSVISQNTVLVKTLAKSECQWFQLSLNLLRSSAGVWIFCRHTRCD